MRNVVYSLLLSGGLALAPLTAHAQAEEEGDFIPPAEQLVYQHNGLTYATGGAGEEDAAALKAMGHDFSLHVLSTLKSGAFLGDYTLKVYDTAGAKLLEAPGQGPLFFVKLAPGSYVVEETLPDQPSSQRQNVRLTGNGNREVHFTWNAAS